MLIFSWKKVALIDKYKDLGGSWGVMSPFKDDCYDVFEHYLQVEFYQKFLKKHGFNFTPGHWFMYLKIN